MSGESRKISGGLSGKALAWLGIVVWLVAAPVAGRLRADDGKGGPLPPRPLLRIGTDDLRTTGFVTAIAFSPDGRLIAAGDADAPSPRVAIFDVHTGRRIAFVSVRAGQSEIYLMDVEPDRPAGLGPQRSAFHAAP